jgi:hypothetical protein
MVVMPLDKQQLRPHLYPALLRLGPPTDGGYVIPVDQVSHCRKLISLGLCDNWKFDKELLKLNPSLSIVGVDHTVGPFFFISRIPLILFKICGYALLFNRAKVRKHIDRLHTSLEYFTFFGGRHRHLKNRVSTSGTGPRDITLTAILDTAAGGAERDVFLKMDIEGSEYEVVPDIVRNQERIRCLVAEFHFLDERTEQFNQAIQLLERDFSIVHVHGNNIAPYDQTNDFPVTIEISWVNKHVLEGELPASTLSYPREGLDIPNTVSRPDYELHF